MYCECDYPVLVTANDFLWTRVKGFNAVFLITSLFWGESREPVLPSQLTQGLEYYALKNDQVLGLLQVSLRLRGQAGYSLGGIFSLVRSFSLSHPLYHSAPSNSLRQRQPELGSFSLSPSSQ